MYVLDVLENAGSGCANDASYGTCLGEEPDVGASEAIDDVCPYLVVVRGGGGVYIYTYGGTRTDRNG